MSRRFEEIQTSLNSQILDVINAAIESKVLPSIKNAVGGLNSTKNTNLDLRSDGLHPSIFSQVRPQGDLRSNGQYQGNASEAAQNTKKDFPRLAAMSSNRLNHHKENLTDLNQSNDDEDYDSYKSLCSNNSLIFRKQLGGWGKKHKGTKIPMLKPVGINRNTTSCNI